jgi:23S rRNA pseudouridine2605 synthase
MADVRLQKVLARAGVASRRAAEKLIEAGRVRVDGRVVTELGTRVDPRTSRVEVDGQRVVAEDAVYVVLHKPRGVVSTMSDPEGRPTVKTLLADVPARVYPVGRLDFNTSGVLLATNDGDFAVALMHPRKAVPKTYFVKVQGEMVPKDLERWRRGVELDDGPTLPAKAKLLRHEGDKTWIELTITEGRNQQVRRMGEATGYRVMRLARAAFADVTAEKLRPGEWRYLTADELTKLKRDYGVPRRIPRVPEQPERRRAWHPPQEGAGGSGGEGDRGHPRYGGGSPVRRDLGVRDDWGGGIRRGSSGGSHDDEGPRTEETPGRGGRTRTTGTGGGIGASPKGGYRVRDRRGRR